MCYAPLGEEDILGIFPACPICNEILHLRYKATSKFCSYQQLDGEVL